MRELALLLTEMREAEVLKLLERQAAWQKSRKDLPWPEKIRMAAAIRDSVLKLRQRPKEPASTSASAKPKPHRGS